MTDHQTEHEPPEPQRPMKLNLALSALLDELADDVAERYPMGAPNSAEHLLHYDALRNAFSAIENLMTVQPADYDHRTMILDYVRRAWQLTAGNPAHDRAVDRALTRARQDYMPEVPQQRQRSSGIADDANSAGTVHVRGTVKKAAKR